MFEKIVHGGLLLWKGIGIHLLNGGATNHDSDVPVLELIG
jgi:hypothetical protein